MAADRSSVSCVTDAMPHVPSCAVRDGKPYVLEGVATDGLDVENNRAHRVTCRRASAGAGDGVDAGDGMEEGRRTVGWVGG